MTATPPEVDRWISAEFQRLAEIVRDYDYNLELRWIPPEQRTDLHDRANPYCIWDNYHRHIVMFASELDTPVGILEKLFNIDNKNGDVFQKMMAKNDAAEAFKLKEELDAKMEAQDLAAFALKNTKSRWKHNGIVYDDEFRRVDER